MQPPKQHMVVLFLEKNARIVYTNDTSLYRDFPGTLIDPDLTLVNGHPPHYWKNENGKVVPHTTEEKIARDHYHGIEWKDEKLEWFFKQARKSLRKRQLVYSALAAILPLLALWLMK